MSESPIFVISQDFDPEFLTTRELAKRAKVTERTIQNWTADGIIPSLKIGRIRRYLWSEVRAALVAGYQVSEASDDNRLRE